MPVLDILQARVGKHLFNDRGLQLHFALLQGRFCQREGAPNQIFRLVAHFHTNPCGDPGRGLRSGLRGEWIEIGSVRNQNSG